MIEFDRRKELTNQLRHKEDKPNAHRGQEGGLVLDHGQHDDHENQLGRQEDLDEQTLRDRGSPAQSGGHVQRAGEQGADYPRRRDAAHKLGSKDRHRPERLQAAYQVECQSNLCARKGSQSTELSLVHPIAKALGQIVRRDDGTYRRIEQSACHPVEGPHIDHEREPKAQR